VAAASCPGCAERIGGVVVDPTDDTRVWIAHSGPQGVRVLTSNDGARTFTTRAISSAANVDVPPAIGRAADGLLAVAWSDAVATRISTSADGGATWTVSTPVGPPAAAVAVAVARSGRLAVGFTSPQGRAVTVSPDGGKHFSAPLALSDGAAAGRVSVVADNSGRWLVAWATQAGIQLARLTATPPST
jgi:hypothetical protein